MSDQKQRLEDDDDDDVFDENGILKDGKTWRVPMRLADSMQRQVAAHAAAMTTPRLHDGRGGPVGQRRGFIFTTDGAAGDAKQRAYDQHGTDAAEAYKIPPTGFGSREFIDQREGDLCTINGWPGHLRRGNDGKLTCVPEHNQDAATTVADAKTQAYLEYENAVANAWRGGQS